MSISVSEKVWKYGPTKPCDRATLLALADHCDARGGNCFPGIPLLMEKCGVSKRALQYRLRRLESEGWITTIIGSGRRSTRYQIILPMLTEELHLRRAVGCTPEVQRVAPEPSVEPSFNPPSLSSLTMSGDPWGLSVNLPLTERDPWEEIVS